MCITRGDAYRPDFSPDNALVVFYVPHDVPQASGASGGLEALPCMQLAAPLAEAALGVDGYAQYGGGLEEVRENYIYSGP